MIPINKIICGDNVTVLRDFPDECIDITVTSPPYDNLRTYKGFSWDFDALAVELFRVTKPGGVVVWVVGDATINGSETGTSFRQALKFMDVGFNLHDTMIYKKNAVGACGSQNGYQQAFEYMFVLTKPGQVTFNAIRDLKPQNRDMKQRYTKQAKSTDKGYSTETHLKIAPSASKRQNVWTYDIGSFGGTGHPAVFPLPLATDHIISWSNPGDLVLDPFMGSGTTAIAAIRQNRRYIGIEIAQEYVDLANERINLELAQTDMFREVAQ
jgi:site-specific DNA-methyltransferase (adenine-specific)